MVFYEVKVASITKVTCIDSHQQTQPIKQPRGVDIYELQIFHQAN